MVTRERFQVIKEAHLSHMLHHYGKLEDYIWMKLIEEPAEELEIST